MKKALSMLLAVIMVLTLFAGCGEKPAPTPNEELSAVQQIIKEAEGMTLEELAKKAIEESNGKTFYGVGNSSRGKSALPLFIEYLQSIDSSYTLNFEVLLQPQRPRSADPHRGGGPFLQPRLYQHGPVRGDGDLLQVSEILRPDG